MEKRSSLPPNPAAGLALPPLVVVFVVAEGALLHPPNSSSADTLGAGGLRENPPDEKPPEAPGTIGWLEKDPVELPQPKSFTGAAATGLGAAAAGCGLGASGAAQAFPHTSEPEKLEPPKELVELTGLEAAGATAGAALGWADRLKTEDGVLVDSGAAEGWAGATARGGDGAEKSKRSPRAAEGGAAVGLKTWAGGDARGGDIDPKPPKEFPMDCLGWCAGAAGLASKKLPPLRVEKDEVAGAAAGRGDEKLPRFAKASFWGGLTGGELAKLRLLKASFIPPKAFWLWPIPVGELMPPLIEPEGAWGAGCC